MSVNELATIRRHNLNIKIILLNNHQHSMCVKTEDQWFGGRNAATTPESGLGFPEDWRKLAESFGIECLNLDKLFNYQTPGFCEVEVGRNEHLAFQVKYGEPIA